jgi:hypothetical protein
VFTALVFLVLLALAGGLALLDGQAASLEAALGQGTPGYFLVREGSCTAGCQWHGEFTAADGRIRREDVTFSGSDAEMHPGSRVPVLYPPADLRHLVFPRHGNWDWVRLLVAPSIVLCLMLAMTWAFIVSVIDYWRGRRQRRTAGTAARPPGRGSLTG